MPSSFWIFSWPTGKSSDDFEVVEINNREGSFYSTSTSENISKKYWRFKRVVFTKLDLTPIDRADMVDKVFKQFNVLQDLEIRGAFHFLF